MEGATARQLLENVRSRSAALDTSMAGLPSNAHAVRLPLSDFAEPAPLFIRLRNRETPFSPSIAAHAGSSQQKIRRLWSRHGRGK
jgi:hypothetical protein